MCDDLSAGEISDLEHEEMAQRPIVIIGAGIAGLTLGRCLKWQGIPTIIYEKASAHPRHNYGIILQSWAFRPFGNRLSNDMQILHRETAVDNSIPIGAIDSSLIASTSKPFTSSFFAHRGRLDELLSLGLDIRRKHPLKEISLTRNGASLSFESGETVQPSLVIAADGVHSQVRQALVPEARLNVLPCVVFNGQRQVEKDRFQAIYAPHFQGKTTILERQAQGALLRISVSKYATDAVDVSYTYSRLPRPDDPLHKPARSNDSATDIPEAFFDEVGTLRDLEQPFSEVFNTSKMKNDRLLHWLMRSIMVPLTKLNELTSHRIVMIGDSAHAEPILGGLGANKAIEDGMILAESIANPRQDLRRTLVKFNETMYQRWADGVSESEKALLVMHEG